jgi:hypothetical protein
MVPESGKGLPMGHLWVTSGGLRGNVRGLSKMAREKSRDRRHCEGLNTGNDGMAREKIRDRRRCPAFLLSAQVRLHSK